MGGVISTQASAARAVELGVRRRGRESARTSRVGVLASRDTSARSSQINVRKLVVYANS